MVGSGREVGALRPAEPPVRRQRGFLLVVPPACSTTLLASHVATRRGRDVHRATDRYLAPDQRDSFQLPGPLSLSVRGAAGCGAPDRR
jgi:hypothetical protein